MKKTLATIATLGMVAMMGFGFTGLGAANTHTSLNNSNPVVVSTVVKEAKEVKATSRIVKVAPVNTEVKATSRVATTALV